MQLKLRPSTAEYKSPCTADTLLAPFSAALNSANRVERSVMSLAQACCAIREAASAAIPLPPHNSRKFPQESFGRKRRNSRVLLVSAG